MVEVGWCWSIGGGGGGGVEVGMVGVCCRVGDCRVVSAISLGTRCADGGSTGVLGWLDLLPLPSPPEE